MNEQKNVLETDTLLNSINRKGVVVLNVYDDNYRKSLTNILLLESLNVKKRAVLVFTFNQTKEDLINDLLCTEVGISTVKRNLQDSDWIKMIEVTEKLKDSSIYITDDYRTVDDIALTVCKYVTTYPKELNFVFIDNLSKIQSDVSFELIIKDLIIMADHHDISVIILK